MRTESSRIQGEIAISKYKKEGITEYEWVAEPSACDICAPLDGKRFKVKGADIGNPDHPLFPMHPNCRCAIVPVPMDREEYNAWLDHIDQGGTTEKWERQKKPSLGEKRQAEKLRRKAEKGGIVNTLPKADSVVIPDAKFSEYAVTPDKQPDKAKAFKQALGYDLTNYKSLIDQIYKNVKRYSSIEKGNKGWGMTYEVIVDIKGPNGKTAKVLTAWIDDKNNGEMRLTTVHID